MQEKLITFLLDIKKLIKQIVCNHLVATGRLFMHCVSLVCLLLGIRAFVEEITGFKTLVFLNVNYTYIYMCVYVHNIICILLSACDLIAMLSLLLCLNLTH